MRAGARVETSTHVSVGSDLELMDHGIELRKNLRVHSSCGRRQRGRGAISWWTERKSDSVTNPIPWWTAMAAGAAPVVLVCGFLVAAALQATSYDPIRDTISSLAARGATDPWAMTAGLIGVGVCYLLTAFGLRPARHVGRAALAAGGVATLSIAAFPTPLHGYSRSHALAVIAASTTMCAWPVMAAHRRHRARVLTIPPNAGATAVTFGLIMWFAFEIHGGELGLAERCAAVAPALWLFPVVFMTRRAVAQESSARKL